MAAPAAEDPADWLPALIKDKWDLAVDSLRGDGVTFPTTPRPRVEAESTSKAVVLTNGVLIKAYQSGDERVEGHTHGYGTKDDIAYWTLSLQVDHRGNAARPLAWACRLILGRLLELHRKNPHAEWDLIESWSIHQARDFADAQNLTVPIILSRRGRVMATAITDNQ